MNQLYGEINKLKQGNFQDYETFYNLTCQYIYKIIKDIVVDGFKRSFFHGSYSEKREYVRKCIAYYESIVQKYTNGKWENT